MDKLDENAMFDAAPAPSTGMPRESLVDTATAFLLNPRSRGFTATQQRGFFEKKGLTPVEIDMAFQRSMVVGSYNRQSEKFYPVVPSVAQGAGSWAEAISRGTMGLAMMSSAAYALYWVWKTYIEPSMGPSLLERQVEQLLLMMRKETEERRARSNETSEQLLKLAQSIVELKQEVALLKTMSLGRNQFALTPGQSSLPAWQRKPIKKEDEKVSDEEEKLNDQPGTSTVQAETS